MPRDLDAAVPLHDDWDLIYEDDNEHIYEHSDRCARMQIQLVDDIVTGVQLLGKTNDGWDVHVNLGMDDRTDHPESHRNEIVHEAERSFAMNPDEYPLREPETNDITVAEDDSEILDTSDSEQTTLDDIIVAD